MKVLSNSDSFLLLPRFHSNRDSMMSNAFLFGFLSHLRMQEIVSFWNLDNFTFENFKGWVRV